MSAFLSLLLLLGHFTARADDGLLQRHIWENVSGKFAVPNEEYPQKLFPYLRNAPYGAYVSVGTERGFLGAANSPNVTRLILIDRDVKSVAYNQVNTLLLRISSSRYEYLRLRLHPSPIRWKEAAIQAGLTQAEIRFLDYQCSNWRYQVAQYERFTTFHTPPRSPKDKFGVGNYLNDDAAFAKIHALAKDNKILALQLDLSFPVDVQNFVWLMHHEQIPLSVLDLSNAWWREFIKRESLVDDLALFNTIATPKSLLVTTHSPRYRVHRLASFAFSKKETPFKYSVYTFAHIRSFQKISKFVSTLHWGKYSMSLARRTAANRIGPFNFCSRILLGR